MATALHVKEKAAWKTVSIPQDLLDAEEFDGLVDIQELTDYELVPFTPEEPLDSSYSKVKKRKRQHEIKSVKGESLIGVELQTTPKRKKSKKEEKVKISEKTELLTNLDVIEEVQLPISKLNKQKSSLYSESKGFFIKDKNIDIVGGDKELEQEDKTSEEVPNESNSKKLKKKRKERKNKKKQLSAVKKLATKDGSLCKNNIKMESVQKMENKPKLDMSQWQNLCVPDELMRSLQDQGFEKPTEIQTIALPSAIRDRKDILGAAETGSGKTLAFGIPVLAKILSYRLEQNVSDDAQDNDEEEMEQDGSDENQNPTKSMPSENNKKSHPLALILQPTRELAVQVKNHLTALAKYTNIKFATIVGGMSVEKQRRILGKQPEVIIATPGRLWQLIEEDNKHLSQVDRILCLVVDEADRMVEKGHYEELTKILEMINKSPRRASNRQTFVMSATLTMDIAAPKRVMTKKKGKKDDCDKLKNLTERICVGLKPKVIDLTPKDKVAQTLTELRVNCKAEEKDFYLYYFLCQHPGRTLVFANSKDCLRRLVSLLNLLKCCPLPLHADMHQRQRLKNLDKFAENDRGLLVASDVAARGLDIPKVDHVLHYQVPRTMENYIHRSGRTARASNVGLSVMLIAPEEAKDYRKIVYGVRNGEELPVMPVEMDLIPAVKQRVGLAREIDVKEYRMKKKRLRNNFFTKAAQEMDMIIDDERLLEDMGDSLEQAQNKQELRLKKLQLESLLSSSLAPIRMSKYPTKSGQLSIKKTINLYDSNTK